MYQWTIESQTYEKKPETIYTDTHFSKISAGNDAEDLVHYD